jgi:hypothetical protein
MRCPIYIYTRICMYVCKSTCQSQNYCTTDGRSVSQYVVVLSPLWDLLPDITSCLKVAVLSLALWGTLSDERTGLHLWTDITSCVQVAVVSVGRHLWREDLSAVCNATTQWSESRSRTILSHLRLPQPGGPSPRIYIPQEEDGPAIPSDTFRRLLWLAGLKWRYSNPPPYGNVYM